MHIVSEVFIRHSKGKVAKGASVCEGRNTNTRENKESWTLPKGECDLHLVIYNLQLTLPPKGSSVLKVTLPELDQAFITGVYGDLLDSGHNARVMI